MIKDIIVAFLVVVSIFFSIMPHRVHCDTFKTVFKTCPSHWTFILNGVILFILAVLVSQWNFIIKKSAHLLSD